MKPYSAILATPRLHLVPLVLNFRYGPEWELNCIVAALKWAADATPHMNEDEQENATTRQRWAIRHESARFIGIVELVRACPDDRLPSVEEEEGIEESPLSSGISTPRLKSTGSAGGSSPLSSSPTGACSIGTCVLLKVRIDADQAGNGYSTEAARSVLMHVFNHADSSVTKVQSVFTTAYPHKKTAEAVMERLGFCVTEQVSPSMRRNGTAVDGWTVWEVDRDGFMELWGS
ncbi:hypothetical protein HDU98_011228 [Podochytrium sp. JEL0797]|nr:hypothetical protein HDU98_011228 [Podochytrium sp. JEL0797]